MIDWNAVPYRDFRDVPPKMGTMALGLAALAFALAFLTSTHYGVASDVANYFASSLRQLEWLREFLRELIAGTPTDALDEGRVFEAWRWYLERLPHPPLSRELSGLGWLLAHNWTDPLTAYRIAVMLCFAALTAWVTVFTHWMLRSRIAGLAAGLAVIAYPALFAHAHLAHTDLFLATFWFSSAASLAVFERTRSLGWLTAAGLLLGAAAATKFSGLLLAPVLGIWLLVRRPREAVPAMVILVLAGVALFVLVNPVLWVAPGVGLADYVAAGAGRAGDAMTRLRTEYFGTLYEFRPPIHYPWVWTLIVLPPTFLLAIVGALSAVRRHWLVAFCLLNMAALYGALLLPWAPMHDGVRLILPALAFQCVLVGAGVHRLIELLSGRLTSVGRPWVEALLLVAVIAPAGASTYRIHPHQLSYANFLVGGTAGVEARGLEVTNLKEVLTPAAVGEIDGLVPPGAVVDPGFMTEEICFYRHAWGLGRDWVILSPIAGGPNDGVTLTCDAGEMLPRALDGPPRDPDFVLVLNREATWRPVDRALFEHGGAPAYEISLDGVPLLRAYRTR